MIYKLEILDSALKPITQIRNMVPLDTKGYLLEYSDRLSDVGFCRFRVATFDPLLATYGNILQPLSYHVRITRKGVVVWQGVITANMKRTRSYIDVTARTYLYMLTNVLIRHDAAGKYPQSENFRMFDSGTLANSITTVLNEAKADLGTGALSGLALGTINNPNFPAGFVDTTGAALSGGWTWTTNFSIKFDYRDILYVIKQLAAYSSYDFQIVTTVDDAGVTTLTFNFQQFIGNKQPQLAFIFNGTTGAIEDYNAPLNADTMANHLWGIAADIKGNILKIDKTDTTSVTKYGKVDGVASFGDVKDTNVLATRVIEELRLVSTPDSELSVTLNDKAYPLGQYGLGDTLTFIINDHVISVNQIRRVVGIDVKYHSTGKETITLSTNLPKDNQ